jgi:hypothetical protein
LKFREHVPAVNPYVYIKDFATYFGRTTSKPGFYGFLGFRLIDGHQWLDGSSSCHKNALLTLGLGLCELARTLVVSHHLLMSHDQRSNLVMLRLYLRFFRNGIPHSARCFWALYLAQPSRAPGRARACPATGRARVMLTLSYFSPEV